MLSKQYGALDESPIKANMPRMCWPVVYIQRSIFDDFSGSSSAHLFVQPLPSKLIFFSERPMSLSLFLSDNRHPLCHIK